MPSNCEGIPAHTLPGEFTAGATRPLAYSAGELLLHLSAATKRGSRSASDSHADGREVTRRRAYFSREIISRNSGVPASTISSNAAISTELIWMPAERMRSKPTCQLRSVREETASAATCT